MVKVTTAPTMEGVCELVPISVEPALEGETLPEALTGVASLKMSDAHDEPPIYALAVKAELGSQQPFQSTGAASAPTQCTLVESCTLDGARDSKVLVQVATTTELQTRAPPATSTIESTPGGEDQSMESPRQTPETDTTVSTQRTGNPKDSADSTNTIESLFPKKEPLQPQQEQHNNPPQNDTVSITQLNDGPIDDVTRSIGSVITINEQHGNSPPETTPILPTQPADGEANDSAKSCGCILTFTEQHDLSFEDNGAEPSSSTKSIIAEKGLTEEQQAMFPGDFYSPTQTMVGEEFNEGGQVMFSTDFYSPTQTMVGEEGQVMFTTDLDSPTSPMAEEEVEDGAKSMFSAEIPPLWPSPNSSSSCSTCSSIQTCSSLLDDDEENDEEGCDFAFTQFYVPDEWTERHSIKKLIGQLFSKMAHMIPGGTWFTISGLRARMFYCHRGHIMFVKESLMEQFEERARRHDH